MESSYVDVNVRFLEPNERMATAEEAQTPLVIEPSRSRSAEFLREFIDTHSHALNRDLAKFGAVLFRGFAIDSVQQFERQILSHRFMRPIRDIMMSEAGRTLVPGTEYVMHTNTLVKTGGTLYLGGFHTENYYVPDVPRFISFYCIRPSWFGGETGLVNTAKVYADLPAPLQRKLEECTYFVSARPIEAIAKRYGLTPDEVVAFCSATGLPVDEVAGEPHMMMFKPSVLQHPLTGERALQINISGELSSRGLAQKIVDAFKPDYRSPRWLIHQLSWKYPQLATVLAVMANPAHIWRHFAQRRAKRTGPKNAAGWNALNHLRVGSAFSAEDIALIARSMRRRYSAFPWRTADMLIVDNLKVAHAGMPGLGPRDLRALLCNALDIKCSRASEGLQHVSAEGSHATLGARLTRWRQDQQLVGGES